MKRFVLTSKKLLSFLLTFIIVFSMFSGLMEVHAAPAISNIRFVRTINSVTLATKEALYIYGSGFVEPFVRVGASGTIPVPINETLSNSYTIVIDDADAMAEMRGKNNIINVTAENIDGTPAPDASSSINLESIPTIDGVSKSKAYVGTPLVISGSQFGGLSSPGDKLYVAGTNYTFGTECTINGGNINIPAVKPPNDYGVADVRIERTAANYEIITIYEDSITVVNQLTGIEMERVDPNAGPKDKRNIISIYGKQPGGSNFTSDMRIFAGGAEGVNKGVITNTLGAVIGVKFELPTRATAGTVDLVISSKNLSSEYVMPAAFVYLDIGNTLTIDSDGINPNFKKETEQKIIEVKGRNIGFFNGTGYDKLNSVSTNETIIGYSSYGSSPVFNNNTYYKVKYTGKYDTTDVTIIREFRVMIDGDATVVDTVYSGTDYTPVFDLSKDIIYVRPADVNLNPNEPKSVDVSIQTITTIFTESGGAVDDEIYRRVEEYTVPNGFTYIPDEISPTITSIMPAYGPSSQEIYMTITGTDFQVLEDGSLPRVRIGGRLCTDVRVYDNQNRVVDGRLIQTGTKLKFKLPLGARIDGAVDVVVINPSGGQKTLANGFEFRNQGESRQVNIFSVVNSYADIRGGIISGETVVITGENFDTSADSNPRVLVTIDGEKATIMGRVSSDGKSVTVIPPPGTVPGMTKLQIINQDGSMASADFEYKLITSNPKITSIVPTKGGKGAKLVIKGEDFILPDVSITDANDPKRKGSVVLLGGKELNAYNYDADGKIVKDGTGSIYYSNPAYDPDGPGGIAPYELNGAMVQVIDSTTIYVDLPDKYYSFGGGSAPYLISTSIPLGDLKVEVLNPDGAKSKENILFEYMSPLTVPVVTSMSPNSGSIEGGTVVTFIGSGFKEDNLEVYFGSELAEDIEFINATQIRATVPRYPYAIPGGIDEFVVPVMVVNYDGGTAVRDNADGFIYRVPSSHPVISALWKASGEGDKMERVTSGSSAGGDSIIIEGLDFRRETVTSNPPDVYFNGIKAEVEWSAQYENDLIAEELIVKIPASTVSGPVDIVLVNYDAGSCTYKGFSYVMSNPAITSITPNLVSNLGNINLEIKGTGFRTGDLRDLFTLPDGTSEQVRRDTDDPEAAGNAINTKVVFGSETTGDKRIINTIVGPYNRTLGDLKFEYERVDPATARITIRKASDNTVVVRQLRNASNQVVPTPMIYEFTVGSSHMFILNHRLDLGINASYDEGILVEVKPDSVIITRRIAPYAKVNTAGTKVTATTPPISEEGVRGVYVINDDGGTASGSINVVSPDSNPTITSITPINYGLRNGVEEEYIPEFHDEYTELYTFVPVDGGAFLTIKGSDYRRNVKVYLEDKLLEIVSKSPNDDELVVKVPPGTLEDVDKMYRIMIVNEDGGVADSSQLAQPYYVEYQASRSNPVVESIVPNRSSNGQDNEITITGYGFEGAVVVSLDGIPCVTVRDPDRPGSILKVTIPAGISPGKKLVMVTNGDYGYTEVRDGITIISSPHIDSVLNSSGSVMDPVIFSIEGGENIQLKGAGFMTGAKVILGGVLKPKSELAQGETGIECLGPDNVEMVVVGGIQVTGATVTGSDTISFTTPKLMSSETNIIVINSDGGVSNVIDASYDKPAPGVPHGVVIEAVDGDTIRLEWDKVEKTIYYELHVSVSTDGRKSETYKYFASVIPEELSATRVVYFVDGLATSTWYSFKIRAVNNYTASKFTASTKYVKTGDTIRNTNYQGTEEFQQAVQEDKVVFRGSEVIYTGGEKSLSGSGVTADFDKQYYSSASLKSVELNFNLIKKYYKNKLTLKDKDIEIEMTANNLAVDEVVMVNSSLHGDTELKISINRNLGAKGDDIRIGLPKGYKLMGNPFGMQVSMQVEKDVRSLRSLKGTATMTLRYDAAKAGQFAGGIYIAYYDSNTRKLEIVETQRITGALRANVSRSGEYMILGKITK